MKIKLTKTGESELYTHLNLTVGHKLSGAIIMPTNEWEQFEEEDGFLLDIGSTVECEVKSEGIVNRSPGGSGPGRMVRPESE